MKKRMIPVIKPRKDLLSRIVYECCVVLVMILGGLGLWLIFK